MIMLMRVDRMGALSLVLFFRMFGSGSDLCLGSSKMLDVMVLMGLLVVMVISILW